MKKPREYAVALYQRDVGMWGENEIDATTDAIRTAMREALEAAEKVATVEATLHTASKVGAAIRKLIKILDS